MFITCKESRIENNRSFYGCFNIGPFDSGESLTVANALRRTLLSECTGLGIVSVSIENVTHEYSTIPGMRESVLDLILNLKEIVLKKKMTNLSLYKKNSSIYKQIGSSYFKPVSGFLKVKGPGVIRAKDLKLPPFICCVDPNQYIATLAEDGFLSMKFIIMEGKGYLLQTQKKNVFSGSSASSAYDLSYKLSKTLNKNVSQTFSEGKSYTKKRLEILKEIKKKVAISDCNFEHLSSFEKGTQNQIQNSPKTNLVAKTPLEKLLGEKLTFFEDKKPSFLKKETNSRKLGNQYEQNQNENIYNTYLQLDTVFNPITKVSYIIEDFNNKIVDELNQKVKFTDEICSLIESNVFLKKQLPYLTHEISLNQNEIYQFVDSCSISEINTISNLLHPVKRKNLQQNIVLEIWTNGSLHPREALNGAFHKLSLAFLNMQKTKDYNPIYRNESALLFDLT